ncbi:MAG: hypothetical protein Q8L41_14760 [Anaerolineales bacterium]|nr:hypothetical protein [Anaerolineales bacterium]
MTKYILPRFSDVIFLSLLISVLLFGPTTFNLDGDLGRHITIGNYILNSQSIPTQDIFSHTMFGQPLTPHEWLSQVIFALAHSGLSLSGAVLIAAILIASAFALVYYDSRQRSDMPFLSLGLTVLAAAASSIHWLTRPHIFTFLYLAVWVYLLENVQRNKFISIWVFGVIMLLWANTHGAFIAGFLVWGAYAAGHILESQIQKQWQPKKLKIWLSIGLLSFTATLLNPDGIHLWGTSFGFIGNTYLVSHTQEYQPVNFHGPGSWPFLVIILLSILILGIKNHRLQISHSLLLAGWTILGLYSARNIPLYAIIITPILTEALAKSLPESRWRAIEANLLRTEKSIRGMLWPISSIGLAIILLRTQALQTYNIYNPSVFPVDGVNWLIENPQDGRIFNHFTWGGYLLYREWPDQLVFIDGQTDFYGEKLTREYEQIISLSGNWNSVLEKYQVTLAIIPTNSPLETALLQHGEWFIIYQDNTSTILKKDG